MYQITSTEKHPNETCCYYAKFGKIPNEYDAELVLACTPEAEEGQKLIWNADATDNVNGGTCVESYSVFEYDELVEVKTNFRPATECCGLGKASDISASSIMFPNSILGDVPYINTVAEQDNLILACAVAITYQCTDYIVGTDCNEITTGPTAGDGIDQTDA